MQVKMGRYSYKHAATINDLLPEEADYSYLKLSTGKCICRRYKTRSKWNLAKQIYHVFFSLLVREIIEHGHIYKLPVQQGAFMGMVEKPQAEVKIKRRQGRYKGVDLEDSDFKIYEMCIGYYRYAKFKKRYVRLPIHLYSEVIDRVNRGQRYLGSIHATDYAANFNRAPRPQGA